MTLRRFCHELTLFLILWGCIIAALAFASEV